MKKKQNCNNAQTKNILIMNRIKLKHESITQTVASH